MSDDRIRFACPACGKNLRVPMKLAGKRGKCPKCKEAISVPNPDDDLPVLEAAGDTGEVEALAPSSRRVRPSSRKAKPASGPRRSSRRARKGAGWSLARILGATAGLGCGGIILLSVVIAALSSDDTDDYSQPSEAPPKSQAEGDTASNTETKPAPSSKPADVRARELAYLKLLMKKAGYTLHNESKVDGKAGSGLIETRIVYVKKGGALYLAMVAVFNDRAEAQRRGWKLIQMPELAVVVGHCMVSTFMAEQIKDVERFPLGDLFPPHQRLGKSAPFPVVIPTGPSSGQKRETPPSGSRRSVAPKQSRQAIEELVRVAEKLPKLNPTTLVDYPSRLNNIPWAARVKAASRVIQTIPVARGQYLKFKCPSCRAAVTARAYQAGSGGTCSDCNSYIKVPGRARFAELLQGIVKYLQGRKSYPPNSSASLRKLGKGAVRSEVRASKLLADLVADGQAAQFIKKFLGQLGAWKAEWIKARGEFIAQIRTPGSSTRGNLDGLVATLRQILKKAARGLTVKMPAFESFAASTRKVIADVRKKAIAGAGGRIQIHARVWAPTDPPYLQIKNLNRFTLTACVVTINGTHTYWPNKPEIAVGGERSLRLDYFRNRQGRSFWPVGTITRIEVRSNQGVWHGELGR